nr:trigger factor [Ardenticatenales bacterium]
AQSLAKEINIPGFRKGKAPYHIVTKMVGEPAILEEVIRQLMPEVAEKAIEESAVEVYSYQDIEADISTLEPLVFHFVIPTQPVVKLGDVSEITVERQPVEIEESRIDEVLENLRESRAIWEPSLGPAAYGDRATLDLRMDLMDGTTVADQKGVEITLAERDEEAAETGMEEEGDKDPLGPDLDAQLVGMLVNQIKEFPLLFPEGWNNPKLSGRTVLYRATLLDLKRKKLAEMDDDFARELNLESMEAVRQRVHDNLAAEAEEQEFDRVVISIVDGLVGVSELDFPQAMIRHEVERRAHMLERQLEPYRIKLDQYLGIVGQERSAWEAEMSDAAEQHVRRALVLSQYIKDHEITAEPDELQQELEMVLAPYPPEQAASLRQRLMQDPEALYDVVKGLLSRKALHSLFAAVTGEEAPPLFLSRPEMEEDEEGMDYEAEEEETTIGEANLVTDGTVEQEENGNEPVSSS